MDWSDFYLISQWVIRLAMIPVVVRCRKPTATMSWLLVIFFEPIIGLILYSWCFGRQPDRRNLIWCIQFPVAGPFPNKISVPAFFRTEVRDGSPVRLTAARCVKISSCVKIFREPPQGGSCYTASCRMSTHRNGYFFCFAFSRAAWTCATSHM